MITKHYFKSIVRAALLLALTMCIIGLAPAFSTSAGAGSGLFSVSDVSGNYVDHGDGWFLAGGGSSAKYAPFSIVGLVTFTAAIGTFQEDYIYRSDGQNHEVVVNGTYTVDANGHGTMTWTNLGSAKHRDFYLVNGGAELKWINTDPPGTALANSGGTMTKQ